MLSVLAPSIAALGFALWWGLPAFVPGSWRLAQLPAGALGLAISPVSGLFVFAPATALSLLGVSRLAPPTRWLGLYVLVGLSFYGGWQDWDATFAYGPRFLVPAIPWFVFMLGTLWERRAVRAPILIAIALGVLVSTPGLLYHHARFGDTHTFFELAPVRAWRHIGEPPDALVFHSPAYASASALAFLCAIVVIRPPPSQPLG